ncbi:Sodium-dependent dopamine transporter [Gryllus bimaculatus]|nr:Sodium-dependent dopamine transporter [Gryllus bimaculatus]
MATAKSLFRRTVRDKAGLRLMPKTVWLDAAVQIFYSVGAGFGVHLSYASYNTFHNNCLRDCLVTTAVNCFTSFFSGFVIFTYLGFMSHKQGVPIADVAAEGPGLVFQVYPEAVATLPGSHLWSMLFFFMLIMLGLDSAGGIYMFHLFDTYSAGISLLCSALFEAIAISWFYALVLCTVSRPLPSRGSTGVVIFGLVDAKPLQYLEYKYPTWAVGMGWTLAFSSIFMIPLVAVIRLLRTPGTLKQRIAYNITPIEEHESIRLTNKVSRFRCKHWLYV